MILLPVITISVNETYLLIRFEINFLDVAIIEITIASIN